MKIGTFVMGGLAGAAIVMMIQRNQMMSAVAASMGQNMKSRMNDMKDEMIGKALNMKFGGSAKRSSSSSNHSEHAFDEDNEDLSKVSLLASKDPKVTEQINAILEQNGQDRI
ncbi:hypothetical protein [Cohnella yongneupensis]|uniref:Uncharacterized protein n=1 Tax=Cohnella yongneupensis TaxID=425006 RepID=A0ABW0R8N6_9BACL